MRDICWFRGTAGHLMNMRDCPSECGTVDTYAAMEMSTEKGKFMVTSAKRWSKLQMKSLKTEHCHPLTISSTQLRTGLDYGEKYLKRCRIETESFFVSSTGRSTSRIVANRRWDANSCFGPEISPSATFQITNYVGYG